MHVSNNYEQCSKGINKEEEYEVNTFNKRIKLIEALSIAEMEYHQSKKKANETLMSVDETSIETDNFMLNHGNKRKETKRFRGKQSIFKCPEGPAPHSRFRSVPDYHRNPHKWIKYSLDDVPSEDMTDCSNTHAALSFLNELKVRKSQEKIISTEKMEVNEYIPKTKLMHKSTNEFSSKVEYRKNNSEKSGSVSIMDHDDKPIFRNSKVILPEYVVGQKQRKKSKVNKSLIQNNFITCVKLNHLQELDEDEN